MKRKQVHQSIIVVVLCVLLVVAKLYFDKYPIEYIYRVQVWQASDAFDWQKFPSHPLYAAAETYSFKSMPDPHVEELFEKLSGAKDWDSFLEKNDTQAFIVIKDGEVRYEKYFNETQRDSIVTSFSVAKSYTSALIGIAIQEGYINSVDDPITEYLPELAERDIRFNDITIRDLLLMSSGLSYVGFQPSFLNLNNDDNFTSYYTDQRKIALNNTNIISQPGKYFQYNKYHPQLLGMILERSTGMPVTTYLQTRIWDKLGMEYDGSWSIDSKRSDFEKMETGVNARAIDFAKFGVLYLNDGVWNGEQVIPKKWVEDSTQNSKPDTYSDYYPDWFASFPGHAYYKYMWWGFARVDGYCDYSAEGDKGQFIYISPKDNLVIIRNGVEEGISTMKWFHMFYAFANEY